MELVIYATLISINIYMVFAFKRVHAHVAHCNRHLMELNTKLDDVLRRLDGTHPTPPPQG